MIKISADLLKAFLWRITVLYIVIVNLHISAISLIRNFNAILDIILDENKINVSPSRVSRS